jgi:hypothetical protein
MYRHWCRSICSKVGKQSKDGMVSQRSLSRRDRQLNVVTAPLSSSWTVTPTKFCSIPLEWSEGAASEDILRFLVVDDMVWRPTSLSRLSRICVNQFASERELCNGAGATDWMKGCFGASSRKIKRRELPGARETSRSCHFEHLGLWFSEL